MKLTPLSMPQIELKKQQELCVQSPLKTGGPGVLNTQIMERREAASLKRSMASTRVPPSVKGDTGDLDQSCDMAEHMRRASDLHIHICYSAPRH